MPGILCNFWGNDIPPAVLANILTIAWAGARHTKAIRNGCEGVGHAAHLGLRQAIHQILSQRILSPALLEGNHHDGAHDAY